EVNHAKSCILTQWTYQHGELNSTQQMRDAYTDALVKYRLAPSSLLQENDHSPELIEQYVDKAYDYMQNPRFSNCSIPYKTGTEVYEGDGEKYSCIDRATFENYLYAFARKSFETDYNMMKKLVVYNAIIDEPSDRGMTNIVNLNNKVFNTTVKKVADEIEADDSITSVIKSEFVESLRKLPHIVTNQYVGTWADRTGDEYVNTFCPLTSHYDAAEQRANYDIQDERWWYVCNNPYYPYPNWQAESSDLLAPRVMGWMQAEYDIVGVLYWSANNYCIYDAATGGYVDLEDWYGANAKRTKHGSSLEGIVFHPGGQYGLSEPVGSLRLEAVRDGLEEYELLLSLKEKYAELGFSSDKLTSSMNSLLYTGAQVFATSENMISARQSLLELCSAVQSPAQMCIVDSNDDGSGSIETKVFMKEGFALKSDNQEVTTVAPAEGGNIYTVVSKMTEDVNYLKLSFDVNGTTYTYTQLLGGKVTNSAPNDLINCFIKNNATVTATVVDKATIGGTGSTLKVEIGATENKTQRIEFRSDVLKEIDAKTKKGVFTIYNPGDEDVEFSVNLTFEKSPLLSEYAKVTLKAKQYTTVELNFSNVTWSKTGSVKETYLLFGATKNENEKILFVDGFALYNK
ncbi:MAG: glycoside hydrolase domain-containing protein, partial [Candidatus Scatosoma sp.]